MLNARGVFNTFRHYEKTKGRSNMKETTKMSRAVGQLEKMYNVINIEKFDGKLPTPIITVQSKPGTWGHCSRGKVWQRKDIDTLIHEMVHLYCRENGIKEVSRGGKYHNKKFKALADEKGLLCVPQGQYGWNTDGANNDALTEYALAHDWTEIKLRRENQLDLSGLLTLIGNRENASTTQTGEKNHQAPENTFARNADKVSEQHEQ